MFTDKDVLCFFGDSITAAGMWIAEVYQKLRGKKIKCYNCGVPGATAYDSYPRLHSHCLIHNPDYVVIMFGMNDITREMYAPDCVTPEKEKIKEASLKRYAEYLELIVNDCITHGATPILCTPTPYDEISDVPEKNICCNKGLVACAETVIEMAEKYHCPFVDFQKEILKLIPRMSIIGPDRVHPNNFGHHVMAQIFMETLGVIDSIDFNTSFKMDNCNSERFVVEQKLTTINYVEYCVLEKTDRERRFTLAERKAEIQKLYEECEDKEAFIPQAYKKFLDTIDFKENLMAELVKLTV